MARVEAAEAARRAAWGHYFPKLRAEANVIVWTEEQTLDLGGGAIPPLPPPQTPYEQVVAGLVQGLGRPTTIREQVTNTTTIQVVQPLTGLYGIHQGHEIAAVEREVARTERALGERKVALGITEAYFRVLQARAMGQAAAAGVESLTARKATVEALERNGLAGRNDVLRIDVALQAARQEAIAAGNGLATARAALAMAMGLEGPTFGPLEPAAPAWADGPVPALAEARARALAARLELNAIDRRVDQARLGVKAAWSLLLPQLNLVGQYQHNEGSELQDEDVFFGGAFLTWIPFEWGATWYKVDEAEAGVIRAEAGRDQLRTAVAFQVESAWYAHASAREALSVAEAAVKQAEEAARLERARFEAQKATTTDLLDAESELTRARMRLEAARYDRLIALARLRDAMGEPLGPTTTGGEQ